jgi:hypothetical protein
MGKLKKQFKQDFDNSSNNINLSFDTNLLETNNKRVRHNVNPHKLVMALTCSVIFVLIGVPIGILFISSINIDESVKTYNRNYSLNEIKIAESNTFKKLNSISYPDGDKPLSSSISDEEKNAYNNFSSLTYQSLVDTSKQDNMSYSLVGLYSLINEMSFASSRDELKVQLNNLLGLDEESRISFYNKVINANSFAGDYSTIQLKNAAFFNNEFNYNDDYINYLSELYCEAYQLNFESEQDKIVEWVNKAVNTTGITSLSNCLLS